MQFLKKYWPTITAALGGVIPFLMPSILEYVKLHPHTTVGVLLAAAVAAYHATAPKDQSGSGSDSSTSKVSMLLFAALCLSSVPSRAQIALPKPQTAAKSAPLSNLYAGGISFNNAGSPSIAGTGLYARLVSSSTGTYAFTVVDALPTNFKPFQVTTNFSGGVAQKVFTLANIPFFVPTAAGVSYNGTNTGWAWSTGGMASIKLKGNWRLLPAVRVAKSSVSNGTGYQPIFGILIGWGQ